MKKAMKSRYVYFLRRARMILAVSLCEKRDVYRHLLTSSPLYRIVGPKGYLP